MAEGELYIDDGHTFNYEKQQFVHRRLTFAEGTLSSRFVCFPAVVSQLKE